MPRSWTSQPIFLATPPGLNVLTAANMPTATWTSLLVARLFRLPASYWAPITTLVVTQSSLGAALAVSSRRFIGTILAHWSAGQRLHSSRQTP